jgi:hypothetical protein
MAKYGNLTQEELKWILECMELLKLRKIMPSTVQVGWLYMLLVESHTPENAIKIVFGEANG